MSNVTFEAANGPGWFNANPEPDTDEPTLDLRAAPVPPTTDEPGTDDDQGDELPDDEPEGDEPGPDASGAWLA